MFDWLDELADEVVLAHPSKVRAIAEARIKTDKIDSETLAHLLRADLIPKAYAPSKDVRAVKRVLRQRLFLVQIRTMVKNRIRALLAQHAIELPKLEPGHIVILDNLGAHKIPALRSLIESRGAPLLYLPPYSPDFNPIELAWSKLKQQLRGVKARIVEHLELAVAEAITTITADDARAFFRHCGYGIQQL
jgi:transposase